MPNIEKERYKEIICNENVALRQENIKLRELLVGAAKALINVLSSWELEDFIKEKNKQRKG